MITTFMIIHAALSVLLVLLVLLQFGKGAEAGLISGSGSDAVFSGATKGNILTKATTVITVLFFVSSINLARIQSRRSSSSIMDDEAPVSAPLNSDAKAVKVPAKKEDAKEKKASTK